MPNWNITQQSLKKGIANTPSPGQAAGSPTAASAGAQTAGSPTGSSKSSPPQPAAPQSLLGSTASQMGGVYSNWRQSWSQAVAGPQKPARTTGQQVAQRVRQVQQVISGAMGLLTMGQDMLNVGFANLTAPIAAMFPSMPAAKLTSLYLGIPHAHTHPPSLIPPAPPVPLPSLGPVLLGTCIRVLIGGLPAARAGDIGVAPTCCGFFPFFQIKTGSSNTFIGGNRAARMLDICMVCTQASDRKIEAGKIMAFLGKLAGMASIGVQAGGYAATAAGFGADIAEAATEDEPAMASAKALSAAMAAAQLAADLAAMALTKMMGKDPGVPPGMPGMITLGSPNVLIGGFPMINIPNPVDMLLNRLKRYVARNKKPCGGTQPCNCPS